MVDEQFKPSEFEEILARLNADGQFTAAVLASANGLAVAASPAPSPYDPDAIAAMATLVKDFVQQTQTRLGLKDVDEVSVVVSDRSRLICRYFDEDAQSFILAVIAPPEHSYRRLTSRAVKEIRAAWSNK